MYKVFEFTFAGVWRGTGIVQAKTVQEARELAQAVILERGFDPDSIELTEVDVKNKAVITWNGDY